MLQNLQNNGDRVRGLLKLPCSARVFWIDDREQFVSEYQRAGLRNYCRGENGRFTFVGRQKIARMRNTKQFRQIAGDNLRPVFASLWSCHFAQAPLMFFVLEPKLRFLYLAVPGSPADSYQDQLRCANNPKSMLHDQFPSERRADDKQNVSARRRAAPCLLIASGSKRQSGGITFISDVHPDTSTFAFAPAWNGV